MSGPEADREGVRLGVEEEFHLLDAATGVLGPRSPEVTRRAARLARQGEVQKELTENLVETATPVARTLADVRAGLTRMRRAVITAAGEAGILAAASGSVPLAAPDSDLVSSTERYEAIAAESGILAGETLVAGMHVHVEVPDRDRAVAVLDRIRAWLPVLVALSASSPYWFGRDTGFASFRVVQWQRWPVAGLPPRSRNAAGYDRTVRDLVDSGAAYDRGQLYWWARLAAELPTIEVRAPDVAARLDDAVVLAGLVRGLVRTALADLDAGRPVPAVPDVLLHAAVWKAARHGLDGPLLDPFAARSLPAAEAVDALVRYTGEAVSALGDAAVVAEGLARLRADGNGAQRQRAAFRRGGLREVTRHIVAETANGLG